MKLFGFFKNLSVIKSQKGFTLIELLVVIGILGILATGLLATIDPLEQFRKGSDSNERTTALELVNAFTRYYAVHNTFPWDSAANGGAACGQGIPTPGTWTAAVQTSAVTGNSAFNLGTPGCLAQLVTEGELKTSFPAQYQILNKLWVADTTSGTSKSVTVCFHPDSKSDQAKPTTNFVGTTTGPTYSGAGLQTTNTPTTTCTGATVCYECTQ